MNRIAFRVFAETLAENGGSQAVVRYFALEAIRHLDSTPTPRAEVGETSSDGPCRENDGCPTELAVLKRFWRSHQPLSPALDAARREPRNDEERAVWAALDRARVVVTKQAEDEQRNAVPLSEVMDFVVRAAAVGMRAGRRPGWGQEAMDLRPEADALLTAERRGREGGA